MLTRPLVVAACVVALAGCDKSASPTEPGRLPSAAGRARLTIDGAPSVPPGSTAQFRATTTAGVVQDVSREATWTTTNPAVLQSLGAGLFAAVSRGEANLVAVYGLGSALFHVVVLESGTFVLRGTVSDSGVGLPGAIVQTIGGPGVDQSVTTDRSGRYALYGVAGAVSLNVTDTGYRPQAQTRGV